MFEKILTRAFFASLFAALAVVGAHGLSEMHELHQAQVTAAQNAAALLIADSSSQARHH